MTVSACARECPCDAVFHVSVAPQLKHAPSHDNLGLILQLRGDLRGAIAAHRAALNADPMNARAANNLGSALGRAGDYAGAVAQVRA